MLQRLWINLNAVSRGFRKQIAAAPNAHWIDEVLVQVIDVLDYPVLKTARNTDIVERRKMLHIFAEADSSRVWTYWHIELCCHEQNRKILIHAGDAAAVNLTDINSFCLEELFEDDAVLTMFAGRDAESVRLRRGFERVPGCRRDW